jgi:shikimate dehydrogenase
MQERRAAVLTSVVLRRAAVLGSPISHSLSPVIHNAAYTAAGLPGWSYTAHECDEAGLAEFVAGLGPEWAGLSLTMPLKEVALDVADEVAPAAAAIGAANTLVRLPDATWRAENTDAPGMVDALRAAGVGTVERVCVLGAGGTARAALAAARELGAFAVTVYARRREAIDQLDPVAADLGLTLIGTDWANAHEAGDADVLISTVPRGVADPVAEHIRWRPRCVLFDAVYDPWPTPLAAFAARDGCPIVSGLDLLLAQAVHQFELYTGVPAPVVAMRKALHRVVPLPHRDVH